MARFLPYYSSPFLIDLRALRTAAAAAWTTALMLRATMALGIELPASNLTLTTPNSTGNTLSMTVALDVTSPNLGTQSQTQQPTITGSCSATFNALFNPTNYQATVSDITFNLQQPGEVSLENETFALAWKVFGVTVASENVNTSNVVLSPDTTSPPTTVSGGLFAANQVSIAFNGGSFVYSGVSSGTQNLASDPLDGANTSTGSGTLAISAPTMSGSVATYTTTLTVPLSVSQTVPSTDYSARIIATGTLQATGTFQFDFGPRTVFWNSASGDFSAGGNWDVGFAPRSIDTAAIQNGGISTLSTGYSATPAAVWVG